jgi:hypothetical protein
MREQQRIEPADGHAELIEPDGGAAARIDEQLLIPGLDQRAGPKAIGTRRWHAGAE